MKSVGAEKQISYKSKIFSVYEPEHEIGDMASAVDFCSSLRQEVAQGLPTEQLNEVTTLTNKSISAWTNDCYNRTEWVNGEFTSAVKRHCTFNCRFSGDQSQPSASQLHFKHNSCHLNNVDRATLIIITQNCGDIKIFIC